MAISSNKIFKIILFFLVYSCTIVPRIDAASASVRDQAKAAFTYVKEHVDAIVAGVGSVAVVVTAALLVKSYMRNTKKDAGKPDGQKPGDKKPDQIPPHDNPPAGPEVGVHGQGDQGQHPHVGEPSLSTQTNQTNHVALVHEQTGANSQQGTLTKEDSPVLAPTPVQLDFGLVPLSDTSSVRIPEEDRQPNAKAEIVSEQPTVVLQEEQPAQHVQQSVKISLDMSLIPDLEGDRIPNFNNDVSVSSLAAINGDLDQILREAKIDIGVVNKNVKQRKSRIITVKNQESVNSLKTLSEKQQHLLSDVVNMQRSFITIYYKYKAYQSAGIKKSLPERVQTFVTQYINTISSK